MKNVIQFDPKRIKAKKKPRQKSKKRVLSAVENLLAAAMELIGEISD